MFHCCVLQGAALIFDHYSRETVPVSMNFTGSTRVFFPAKPHHCRQKKEAQKPSFVSGVFVALPLEPRISCPLRTVEQHNDNSMNFSDLCLGG